MSYSRSKFPTSAVRVRKTARLNSVQNIGTSQDAVIRVADNAGNNIETPLNNRERRELAAKHNLTGCFEPSIQYRSINAAEVGVEL